MELAKDKHYLILGLGSSGMAAVRYLHSLGLNVSVSESRSAAQMKREEIDTLKKLGVSLELGGHSDEFAATADLIIPSPGVPLTLPLLATARRRKIAVAGELALAAGKFSVPVIGVTGSNGKTTVTSLIGHLLRAAGRKVFVGGNIGTPVLEYLQGGDESEIAVLELSSFQLEISGEFRPDIGLFLNISPDHLDRHGTMENYISAKRRIFANQGPGDTAILGCDDNEVMKEPVSTGGTVLRFGFGSMPEAQVTDNGVVLAGSIPGVAGREEYVLEHTALASRVNRLNAAAAILAVRSMGCQPQAIRDGLGSYSLPEHRMALVKEIDGIRYVDDSKATNIGAVAAALESIGGRVILIGGGRDKGSDFSLLGSVVKKHARAVILIGEAADRMAQALEPHVDVRRAGSLEEAVHAAAEIARSGDAVLLSPGCASFDMFTSYAHRGQVFHDAVLSLCSVNQEYC